MRRSIAAAALAMLALAVLLGGTAIAQTEPAFHFAILSDRTGGHTPGIYPQVINEIALLHPDFVVTVGDHIEGYGEDYDRSAAEWDSLLALVDGLGVPVYMTPGNHDIWNETAEEMFVARTGHGPYYSFDYGNTHFVILDVSRIESSADLPDAQKGWLVDDLEQHRNAENTFVFYHKPLWVSTLMVGKSDPLHDIFKKYGVDAVFNGHLHHYFAAEFDGIEYTVMGSSGAELYRAIDQPVPRGEFFQFGWMTVGPSGRQLAVVDLGGIYPRDIVTANDLSEIQQIEGNLIKVDELRAPENTSPRAPVNVTIQNTSNRMMDDVVHWNIPEGWQVEPSEAIVSIEPGQSKTLTFMMMNSGGLYPLPRMSCRYPLSNGRMLDVDLPARVLRTAVGSHVDTPPVIDGDVSDACWQNCSAVTRLNPGYDASVEGETEFAFACDADNLYLSAVCYDPKMVDVAADVTDRDGPIFSEDCVGYFLQPNPDSMIVYQIYINPAGAVFDQKIRFDENMWYDANRAWDGEYDVATQSVDNRWSVEMKIPLSQLGADLKKNPAWRVNFRRKQARTGATADWQVPIDYDPGTFGELEFK